MDVYLNFINGKWKQGSSGQWLENRNPARPAEILGKATCSGATDVSEAIKAAVAAQKEWARRPRLARAAMIEKAGQVLRRGAESLSKVITQEQGKNLVQAKAEVLKAAQSLELAALAGKGALGQVFPSEHPERMVYSTRAPRGVVAVITSWNSPVEAPARRIGPALLEGNAVVFKPSSLTPASTVVLIRAFEEAGFPPGVVNLLFGKGEVVSAALVDDARVAAISYSGSREAGQALHAQAAKRMAVTEFELGGRKAFVVLEDADLELAAQAVAQSAFKSGEWATSLFLPSSLLAPMKEKLQALLTGIPCGGALKDPNALGPLVDEAPFRSLTEFIEMAKKEGAQVTAGGEPLQAPFFEGGYFFAPTVLEQVRPDTAAAQAPIVGPLLAVAGIEEGLETFATTLAGYRMVAIYSRDTRKATQLGESIASPAILVNPRAGEAEPPARPIEAFFEIKMVSLG